MPDTVCCMPGYGYDCDPRQPGGYVSLHAGGNAAVYGNGRDFWNQSFPAGLRWEAAGGSAHGFNVSAFNGTGWPTRPSRPAPWVHMMHHSLWGNHVFEAASVDAERRTIAFGEGGWQEARYIAIAGNAFYVEGARAALDAELRMTPWPARPTGKYLAAGSKVRRFEGLKFEGF